MTALMTLEMGVSDHRSSAAEVAKDGVGAPRPLSLKQECSVSPPSL